MVCSIRLALSLPLLSFSYFMESNGIKHIRCSPYHWSSNGTAEHLMQTFKRSLKVTVQQGNLSLRSRGFVSFCCHTDIVHIQQLIRHQDMLQPNVQVTVENKQDRQMQNYDIHYKQSNLFTGTPIMAKNFTSNPKWLPGIVIDCVALLTYSIQLHDGTHRIWRRYIDPLQ